MRKTLAIIAVLAALIGPLTPAPAAAQTDPREIAGEIDYYWATTFADNGNSTGARPSSGCSTAA